MPCCRFFFLQTIWYSKPSRPPPTYQRVWRNFRRHITGSTSLYAKWFTVFATGSLIPVELYEAIHHFTWLKLAALIANILIVIYLVRIALQSRKEMKNEG